MQNISGCRKIAIIKTVNDEGIPDDMQVKQVHEVAAIVEVGARISNVTLIKAMRNEKAGWSLRFDYKTITGIESCMLVSQHMKPRFWASLNTAVKDINNLFPDVSEAIISFE